MTQQSPLPSPPTDSSYVAQLWDYPQLTISIFGIQIQTEEAGAMYAESGIPDQMAAALEEAKGLLCVRELGEAIGNGGLQLQYWRTHEDLARFARTMPHTAWWKWLTQNKGKGFSFYHEIYQCKTAEAIYETGTVPVGPATFCQTTAVASGEGRSEERQRRFVDAAVTYDE